MTLASSSPSFAESFGVSVAVFVVYFTPTAIALLRRTTNAVQVAMLNLFIGWTVVGWVVALVMSFAGKPPPEYPPAQYGWYRPGRRQGPPRH